MILRRGFHAMRCDILLASMIYIVFGTCFAQETLNNCECAGSRNGTIATENW
jgi:hypothetical protein